MIVYILLNYSKKKQEYPQKNISYKKEYRSQKNKLLIPIFRLLKLPAVAATTIITNLQRISKKKQAYRQANIGKIKNSNNPKKQICFHTTRLREKF